MSNTTTYTGFWFDLSSGHARGATLTIPIRSGNFLITALSVLTTWAAVSAWSITSYLLHQVRASQTIAGPLHLELQVLLRNSTSALDTFLQGIRMQLAWRRKSRRTLRQIAPVIVLAFIIWIGFVIAGIFVAAVGSPSYKDVVVLLKPDNCGLVRFDSTTSMGLTVFEQKTVRDTLNSRLYARNMYNEDKMLLTKSIFTSPTLPYVNNYSEPCMFPSAAGQHRCTTANNTAFSMDTGLLDSHVHFGINAIPANRVQFRKKVTCAPVFPKEFIQRNVQNDNETWEEVNMGPLAVSNYTYRWNVHTVADGVGYQLQATYAEAGSVNNIWDPVSTFNRTDADVSVFFLAQNDITYGSPVFDPWFLANGTYNTTLDDGTIYYSPNFNIQILMCIDQLQFCNPTTEHCTLLGGRIASLPESDKLDFNDEQSITFLRLWESTQHALTYFSVNVLGPSTLLAQERVEYASSPGLPPNQWQAEVRLWFETSLVKLQTSVIEFASKSINPPYITALTADYFTLASQRNAYTRQCANQRIQSPSSVQNFNFLGVMLVIVLSFTLILIAMVIERFVSLFRRFSKSDIGHFRELSSEADMNMHLLRMVLENAGINNWSQSRFGVPVVQESLAQEVILVRQGTELTKYELRAREGDVC